MTLLRRVAVKISSGVVRRASPDTKEWAQATAREAEFIESDWTALGWELGSVRILWQRSEAPITSLAEVPEAALGLAREIRRRTALGLLACAFVLLSTVWSEHRAESAWVRLDSNVLVASVACQLLAQVLSARLAERRLRGEGAAGAGAYRLGMERQRTYHSGVWMWSRILMIAGYLMFCFGAVMAHAPAARMMAATVVGLSLCVAAVLLNLTKAQRYQRRIDELDAMERAGSVSGWATKKSRRWQIEKEMR